ncbi:MAG: ABC transporter permease subunit [Anaerolineae bacterium]|nr:ABC transporter permease subunit [Anaerolineae bacterium]
MTASISEKQKVEAPSQGASIFPTLLKYGVLLIVDAFALIFVYALVFSGNIGLGTTIGFAILMVNVVMLIPALYPLRWMVVGLALVTLLVIYPMFYTIFTAFTNYGDGHLQTKQEIIVTFTTSPRFRYAPQDATTYNYALFRRDGTADDPALPAFIVVASDDGSIEVAFAPLNAPIEVVDTDSVDAPETYQDYALMSRAESIQVISNVQNMVFGEGDDTAQVRTAREVARPLVNRRYVYGFLDRAIALIDQSTDIAYFANPNTGFFEPEDGGQALTPGYRVNVGFENFRRLTGDPSLRGPLTTVFIWTVMFAFLSVFTTFWVGLFMALIMNDAKMPGKKIIRSLLIIPYAIPGVISILIWKGMLNANLGIITNTIYDIFGYRVPWFADPFWARVAVILVNLWLGYPYMMLICSGALQAIPSDIYEAAAVDGASRFDRFWKITLPLLLVTIGPLLIASFVYNFNNYLLIEALTAGDPPIAGSTVPTGFTDILINYTYRRILVTTAIMAMPQLLRLLSF